MREKLIELLDGIQSHGWRRIETDHSITLAVVENKAIAEHLLANGVTIRKWIPVTERLPEGKDRYLCNVKSFAFPGSFYQAILYYDQHGFREGNIYTDDVTHWMSLPEPPEED